MKIKKVNQYICDFCGKKKYSASHMVKHEKRCTLNPGRECGMCIMTGEGGLPLKELLELLPEPIMKPMLPPDGDIFHLRNAEEIEAVMPRLRAESNNCPACIMAALRQKKIPIPAITSFKFTEECKSVWADINEANSVKHSGELW
jgi:hypothetical protein